LNSALRCGWVHADALFCFSHALEFDDAVDEREQGIIAPDTDVRAGMHLGPALPHENAAGADRLAPEALYAQALRITVAAVLGTSTTFFMCHASISNK